MASMGAEEKRPGAPCGRGGCADCADGPGERCALRACCVEERGLQHCGLCLDFPCQLFLSHADALTVGRRYQRLLRLRRA